ncbi:futalosine hydrolase [Sphingobacterium sp. Mn56C]|uniref:futalosine hydrolase n=1 Tax=Sphingobacterium sp. Mn56C TaxID=3395261 RepID=UPI003BBA13D3
MKPLIVAATREEIASSIPFLERVQIPFLITGVGMTATAYSLGRYLALYKPDIVINVGIAGSFNKDFPLGTVVEITKDTFAELGAEDGDSFLTLVQLGFGESTYTPKQYAGLDTGLPPCQGITVNKVHGKEASIEAVKSIFQNIQIETMEGAAVFYVCQQENLPCLQIRALSNYVEKRDKSTWNIPLSIKNLNIWIQSFLKKVLNP